MSGHRQRIHWQLTFYLGCAISSLMLLFMFMDRAQQRKRLIQSRTTNMMQETLLLRMAIQREPDAEKRDEFLETYCATMRLHGRPGHTLAVVDPSGRFHSVGQQITKEHVLQSEQVWQLLSGTDTTRTWIERSGPGKVLVVAGTYRPPSTARQGIVYYSEPLDDIEQLSNALFLQRAGMVLLLLTAVVIIIWLFVKHRVSAPLNALLAHEYAASKGDFRPRAYPDPHNEISDIYDMFNLMLKKIEKRESEILGPEEPATPMDAIAQIQDDLARVSHGASRLEAHSATSSKPARHLLNDVLQRTSALRAAATRLGRELRQTK